MKRGPALGRVVSLVGLSAAGLVGGHALGYALAVPDPHHRSTLLAQTGHGYLSSFSWFAVVCGVSALVAGVAAGYARHCAPAERMRSLSRLTAPVQAGGFLLIEIVERLASGSSAGTLSARLLVVGIAVQLVIGLLVALVVIGLRRAGELLGTGLQMPADAQPAVVRSAQVLARRTGAASGIRVRAPPASLSA